MSRPLFICKSVIAQCSAVHANCLVETSTKVIRKPHVTEFPFYSVNPVFNLARGQGSTYLDSDRGASLLSMLAGFTR
jgi:hypothetical protein